MPIAPSKVGVVIDALVALLQASPTFSDPNGPVCYDGPAETSDVWKDAVFIGFDGDWESGNFEAVNLTQTWAYLGATSRHEEYDIRCAAISWSGDDTPKVHRDAALSLLAAPTPSSASPTTSKPSSPSATCTRGRSATARNAGSSSSCIAVTKS
jgi:hypothetical protein